MMAEKLRFARPEGTEDEKRAIRMWLNSRRRPVKAPNQVIGLTGWWKADSLALSDATAVSSWPDSSGNGRPATQGTGSFQPLFKLNQFGTVPGILFDGLDDFFFTAALPASTIISLICILKSSAAAGESRILLKQGTQGHLIIQMSTAKIGIRDEAGVGALSNAFGAFTTARMASWVIQNGGNFDAYEAGSLKNSQAWAGSIATAYDIVGGVFVTGSTYTIGEVCVYNQLLTARDISELYSNYFQPKFGV